MTESLRRRCAARAAARLFAWTMAFLALAAAAGADTICGDVHYPDNTTVYECFETVHVVAPPIYVQTTGWWGPSGGPTYPPEDREIKTPPVSGSVAVTYTNIGDDRVEVSVTGSSPGVLTVRAVRADGGTYLIGSRPVSSGFGIYVFSHAANDLSPGEYRKVRATFSIGSSGSWTSESTSNFTVLGRWRHSQYVTVWERSCVDDRGPAELNCSPTTAVRMAEPFMSQAWLNGSGVSKDYGLIQLPWSCMPASNQPAWGKRFAQVSEIAGSCSNGAIDDNTLASGNYSGNGTPQDCGRWIYIVGIGHKQVRDRCPDCRTNGNQYDNYRVGQSPSCGRTENDLGQFQTIMLP